VSKENRKKIYPARVKAFIPWDVVKPSERSWDLRVIQPFTRGCFLLEIVQVRSLLVAHLKHLIRNSQTIQGRIHIPPAHHSVRWVG
jgi:hypothetical protein